MNTRTDGINDCSCSECVGYCERRPGWFLPEEIEPLAKFLKLNLQDCFDQFLGADYWAGGGSDGENIWLLAPAIQGFEGSEYPYNPIGRCTFLDERNRCSIHAVKPYECRAAHHANKRESGVHEATAMAWKAHQGTVISAMCREPAEPDGSPLELLEAWK